MQSSQTNNPVVSVIMPNRNGEKFLADAIESVVKQTFQEWELLVIDDSSTDNSLTIALNWSKSDSRIHVLNNRRQKVARGPCAARNTGIDAARGRYIAFLDSDDLWLPEKLDEQLTFMTSNEVPFSFCWYNVIQENGLVIGARTPQTTSVTYRQLLRRCIIGCLTAMYDTEKLGKQFIDPHPNDRFADYSLWLKILKITPKAYCLPKIVAQYRLVSGSISASKLHAAKHNWLLLRTVEQLNFPKAAYYFSWYASCGVLGKIRYLFHRNSPQIASQKNEIYG